jgi:hypothetical protein
MEGWKDGNGPAASVRLVLLLLLQPFMGVGEMMAAWSRWVGDLLVHPQKLYLTSIGWLSVACIHPSSSPQNFQSLPNLNNTTRNKNFRKTSVLLWSLRIFFCVIRLLQNRCRHWYNDPCSPPKASGYLACGSAAVFVTEQRKVAVTSYAFCFSPHYHSLWLRYIFVSDAYSDR